MLREIRIKLLNLFYSTVSNYKISKNTGIPESTLSRVRRSSNSTSSLRFDTVEKLIKFYDEGVGNMTNQTNDLHQFDDVFKSLLNELSPAENTVLEKDLGAFREFVLTLFALSLKQLNKSTFEKKYKSVPEYLLAARDIIDDTKFMESFYIDAYTLLNSKTVEYAHLRALSDFDDYVPLNGKDDTIYAVYVQTLTLLNLILEANKYYSMVPALKSVVKTPTLHSNQGQWSYTIHVADKAENTHMCTVQADKLAEAELKAVYHLTKDRNLSAFDLDIQSIKRFTNI